MIEERIRVRHHALGRPAGDGHPVAGGRPNKILFGSDWPYCPEDMAVSMINALETNPLLDEKLQRAIARDNALKLFPRLAA